MSKKRGARVAPPPRPGEWVLRFHDSDAYDGWENLCSQAPGPARAAWDALTRDPCDRSNPSRQFQLKRDLATRTIGGETFEQWQHEVTGAGRIWYCPVVAQKVVIITLERPGPTVV